MSVIPVSCLSASELAALGDNVLAAVRLDRRDAMNAVNRSLSVHGERVDRLVGRSTASTRGAAAAAAAPRCRAGGTGRKEVAGDA